MGTHARTYTLTLTLTHTHTHTQIYAQTDTHQPRVLTFAFSSANSVSVSFNKKVRSIMAPSLPQRPVNRVNGFTMNGIKNVNKKYMSETLQQYEYEDIEQSASYILNQTKHRPSIGIICGSGLGGLAELLEDKDAFPYEEVPHFPTSTVAGHAGRMSSVSSPASLSSVCKEDSIVMKDML